MRATVACVVLLRVIAERITSCVEGPRWTPPSSPIAPRTQTARARASTRQTFLSQLMMGMVSGDNRVGDEVYRCLLPILWHDNHT